MNAPARLGRQGARDLRRTGWLVGMVGTGLVLLMTALGPVWLIQAREALFDTYQRLHPRAADPAAPVHVVLIDEPALAALGQWPWPRTYLAEMAERLLALGAVTVGFDILLSEPDRTSPEQIAESWRRFGPPAEADPTSALRGLPAHDAEMARRIAGRPVVLGVSGIGQTRPERLMPKAGVARTGAGSVTGLAAYPGLLPPRPALGEAAAGLGLVSLGRGDGAGITRAVPMVSDVAGTLWPSLAAELLRVAQGAGGHVLRTAAASGEGSGGQNHPVEMRSGAAVYPLDRAGRVRVHFAGHDAARYASAAEILGAADPSPDLQAAIAGRIVLVGASAQALFDVHATPLAPVVPGVVIQAELLEQIIAGQFLTRPDWMLGLELALVALTGVVLTWLSLRASPQLGIALWSALVAALLASGYTTFAAGGLLFDPLPALATAVLVYIPLTSLSVLARDRARARIRNSFAHFLPDTVIAEIADNPDDTLTPLGADRDITVIFIDMRGFTGLTERMDPRDVVQLLNRYLAAMADTLVGHGATIDKFIGDAIMAFWNAPLTQEGHQAQALRALAALHPALEAANRDLAAQGLPEIGIRAGINAGPAFVGLLGSNRRLNYSAIGDCVTVAARLEALTRRYGVDNLVGETALGSVPDELVAVWLDEVTVRGRSQPLRIATVLRRDVPGAEDLADLCDRVRASLRAGAAAKASDAVATLRRNGVTGVDVDLLADIFQARIDGLEGPEGTAGAPQAP